MIRHQLGGAMKKMSISFILILGLLTTSYAEDHFKFLKYKFNDNVTITISNSDCPFPELRVLYPYANIAKRIDGAVLLGCYNNEGDNIVIQWLKGDKTILPANVFLIEPTT